LDVEIGDLIVASSCMTMDAYSLAHLRDEAYNDSELGMIVEVNRAEQPRIPLALRSQLAQDFACAIHVGRVFSVPAVSWETEEALRSLQKRGFIGVDLETGPFLAACRRTGMEGLCIHWVTDEPLRRDFYYHYEGDPDIAAADQRRKYAQWLNLPKLILPIVTQTLSGNLTNTSTAVSDETPQS
jgi:purine-nucleoside phosphorylase